MSTSFKLDLWSEITSLSSLDRAWERVRSNGGCSGGDNITINHFQSDAARRLMQLSNSLKSGDYSPAAIRQIDIPKAKGGVRRLLIPSLSDRIVHTSIANGLVPILEPQFEDSSFAYRPGRSVDQAVRAIEQWRKDGYWHVIEADIVGYFDAIRHEGLIDKLSTALTGTDNHEPVVSLLAHWLEHLAAHTGIAGKGVAQGSPVSPILANLYLDALDEALDGRGIRLVRFADDFVILCKKRETAERALRDATTIISDHGLELHPGGTRIIDFDRGFEFLGHLFVRSFVLQSMSDPEEDVLSVLRGVEAQDKEAALKASELADTITREKSAGFDRGDRVLYLTDPDRRLALQNLSFSIETSEGKQIAAVAHHRVDRIEIGSGTQFSPNLIPHAMATDTDLLFVNGLGETEAWLAMPSNDSGALQLSQASVVLDPTMRTKLVPSQRLANFENIPLIRYSYPARAANCSNPDASDPNWFLRII